MNSDSECYRQAIIPEKVILYGKKYKYNLQWNCLEEIAKFRGLLY
jgi:hypothetical protein